MSRGAITERTYPVLLHRHQWISHQLTITSLSAEIMAAYPLLYQAGYDDLAELA